MSTTDIGQARPKYKIALSWIVVGLGLTTGIYSLSALAVASSPSFYGTTSWFFRWSELIGIALLTVECFAGSLIAIHSRKRAGVFFIASLPFTVFCLVYQEARLVSGVPAMRAPSTIFGLVVEFALSLGIFLFFGLFWLGTHWRRWPALTATHPQTWRERMARAVVVCLVLLAAVVPLGMAAVTLRPSVFGGHCGRRPPFIKARSEDHAVFTVRVICVGLSLRNWLSTRSGNGAIRDHRVGEWAIGVVQERFWGLPSRWPHLVMLTDNVYWQGEMYFIDGYRGSTLLNYFVPVVSAQYGCSRTRPIQSADLDLRILRHPPSEGATIIGYVRQPAPYHDILERPSATSYLSGAQIEVSGPDGMRTLTTDASGIYQLEGLPAGDYVVQLLVPDGETVDPVPVYGNYLKTERSTRNLHLNGDEIIESTFNLDWASKDKSPKQ